MAEVLCACGIPCDRSLASVSRIQHRPTSTRNHERRNPPLAQLLAPMAAAIIQARNGRLRRPMVQRFQSPTLQASADGKRRRTDGAIDRLLECRVPFLHDDA